MSDTVVARDPGQWQQEVLDFARAVEPLLGIGLDWIQRQILYRHVYHPRRIARRTERNQQEIVEWQGAVLGHEQIVHTRSDCRSSGLIRFVDIGRFRASKNPGSLRETSPTNASVGA